MSELLNFNRETGCLFLKGELSIYEANNAFQNLCAAFSTGELRNIDLSGVTELDAAGLQILLMARSLFSPAGEPVALVNHSHAVRDVLGLTGLGSAA